MDLGNVTTVGLDLGSTGFRAVELAWQGGRPRVVGWAGLDFPKEIEDWTKVNAVQTGGRIGGQLKERGVRAKLAAHSICGKAVVPQYFNFPQLMDEDVAEAVRIEVESGLPFRVEDTLFAYILFPEQRAMPGKARTHGLAIAADGGYVESRLDILRNASLEPFCVETDATACANAFLASRKQTFRDGAVGILNVGGQYTNLALLGSDGTLLMRDVPWAGGQLTKRIGDLMNVPSEMAERMKRLHWEKGAKGAPDLDVHMAGLLRDAVRELVDRLRDTIHYWVSERLVPSLRMVYVTGGGSQVRGLPELLSDALSVPVERWSPVEDLHRDTREGRETWDYRLTVAYGLALRRFDRSA